MSFQDLVQYFIEGFPVGCVYALVAVGIVLTYKTSGVFNLAFGAQAFLSAAVMYEMRQGDILGIGPQPMWLCLVVSVFIVAPLFGLLLDRVLFRYMRNSIRFLLRNRSCRIRISARNGSRKVRPLMSA